MKMNTRTHHCGELRREHIDQTPTLCGWVNNYRDHGGVRFIDLRDREGLTQIVFHPQNSQAHALAQKLRHEDVVQVTGKCITREGGENPKLPTGQVEVDVTEAKVLSKADTPPFMPAESQRVGEDSRLRHRYLDLRRPEMARTMRVRHRAVKTVRDYFDELGFLEIETPFLCKSTPEGARDFLVPSRLQPGEFYALPQSPQLFKQVLMVGGLDRYFQIVRCFRDEDPRADRQAEFSQIDIELSFVDQDEVMRVNEELVRTLWDEVLEVEVPPIERMSYDTAITTYGSDRPDLRFGLELVDVSDLAGQTDFKVFNGALDNGGLVKAIRVPGGGRLSRKETDALAQWVKQFGAGGLPVTKVDGASLSTGIAKFVEPITQPLIQRMQAEDGDLICFGVDKNPRIVHRVLGELRAKLARDLGLIPDNQWKWVWITDFPLVEWNDQDNRWDSLHHPFTAPADEDLDKLSSNDHEQIASIKSKAYDLVLNGSELGGGSIRIHQPDVQRQVFGLLGISEDEANEKFSFLLDALRYGAPPHGGIAFGLDRIIMQLTGMDNIRDVIAFPKTQTGADLMTGAPGPVHEMQLRELNLRVQSARQKDARAESQTTHAAAAAP